MILQTLTYLHIRNGNKGNASKAKQSSRWQTISDVIVGRFNIQYFMHENLRRENIILFSQIILYFIIMSNITIFIASYTEIKNISEHLIAV